MNRLSDLFNEVLDHPILFLFSVGLLGIALLVFALRRQNTNPRLLPYCFIGFCFLLIPIQLFLFIGRRYRDSQLEKHGIKIEATILSVRENTHLRINHRYPWLIDAQWTDPQTQKTYFFVSHSIGFDPRPRLSGTTIPVLIDPGNPRHYAVDLSLLYTKRPADVISPLRGSQK